MNVMAEGGGGIILSQMAENVLKRGLTIEAMKEEMKDVIIGELPLDLEGKGTILRTPYLCDVTINTNTGTVQISRKILVREGMDTTPITENKQDFATFLKQNHPKAIVEEQKKKSIIYVDKDMRIEIGSKNFYDYYGEKYTTLFCILSKIK